MSKNNILVWLLAGFLLMNPVSCNSNRDITAPRYFLPSGPVRVAKEAYGGWMEAILDQSEVLTSVRGELITIHEDTVYILSQSQLNGVPVSAVKNAKLELHLPNATGFTIWSVAGGLLSPFVNGYYSLFTFPAWLISGIAVSTNAANQPNMIHFPATGLEEFKKFSRFPQGLPAGLELDKLEPKPLSR